MYTINKKNKKDPTYSIYFNSDEVNKYFESHGSASVTNTTDALHIFLCASNDLFEKQVDLELFCGIINKIYWNDKLKYSINFDNDQDYLLEGLSELEYYKAKGDDKQIDYWIEKLREYFDQNKHLLFSGFRF